MTTLTDAVRYAVLQQLSDIHTALPAQIVKYDYQKQKAQVQPLLSKRYTGNLIDENTNIQQLPLINNVPVIFPRAGGASLNFPVDEGDTCLLVFMERSIDTWKSTGGIVAPTDPRKFDLSDAVAIMGLFPFTEESSAENNEDLSLSFKGSKISIKPDGSIQIKTSNTVAIGTLSVEVLEVISQTLGFLSSLTAIPPIPPGGIPAPSPLTFQASAAALKIQLDSIKGVIS